MLQKFQKPANVTDEQFKQYVDPKRALFNSSIGFVALQRKDYANAITALKAATADNPSDVYTFYRLGLAYLYSTPPDYDHAIWYIARAVALAKAAKDRRECRRDARSILKQAYVSYHGTDTGLADILDASRLPAPTRPTDLRWRPRRRHKPTGNQNVDAFQHADLPAEDWVARQRRRNGTRMKGQPLGLGGTVIVWKRDLMPDTYLVRIAIARQHANRRTGTTSN